MCAVIFGTKSTFLVWGIFKKNKENQRQMTIAKQSTTHNLFFFSYFFYNISTYCAKCENINGLYFRFHDRIRQWYDTMRLTCLLMIEVQVYVEKLMSIKIDAVEIIVDIVWLRAVHVPIICFSWLAARFTKHNEFQGSITHITTYNSSFT